MMRRVLPTIGIAVALLAGLALPASASTLPDTRYRILSVVLVPRTGDVVVTAKTSCAGKGSMSWDVDLRQGGRHDSGSRAVPCDGQLRTQTITLSARAGRFHAGQADFAPGIIICGVDVCIGTVSLAPLRLLPLHNSWA